MIGWRWGLRYTPTIITPPLLCAQGQRETPKEHAHNKTEGLDERVAMLETDDEVGRAACRDSPMTTTGAQTAKNLTASLSTPPMPSCRYMKPTSVLMAIKTTLVGVAIFSETRKRSVKTEKVQMSIPLPANQRWSAIDQGRVVQPGACSEKQT